MSTHTFEFVSPDRPSTSKPVDWSICFICQEEEESSPLVFPYRKSGFGKHPEQSSYYSTAENLKQYDEHVGLPIGLRKRLEGFEVSADLARKFVEKTAIFHKSCICLFDKQKLSRKRKLVDSYKEVGKEKQQTRLTRKSLESASNFNGKCFFCDKIDDEKELHSCQTLYLDMRIRKIAQEMNNSKLLVKLSEGDMVATEARYHRVCLTQFYNSYRTHTYNKSKKNEQQLLEGIALSEVIDFIEESIISSDKEATPVFRLKELTELYQKRLHVNGASDAAECVHATRLKNAILENVPGLCATKSGKYVLLTLDGELGRALFDACLTSNSDDGFMLSKVAQTIRRDIFQHDEEFDGDLSTTRQMESVPKSLLQLIALIMEGGYDHDAMAEKSMQIAANIAQLIRFNSVKGKRKGDIQNVRHSKKNEPPLPVYVGMLIHNKTRKKSLVSEFAAQGLSITYNRLEEIQNTITTQLCLEYEREGRVCPKSLQHELFTSAAIDNIDSNPSSNTAVSSFHGTSISVFQHPDVEVSEQPFVLDKAQTPARKIYLPPSYTDIQPAKGGKPEPPPAGVSELFPTTKPVYTEADEWILELTQNDHAVSERISFSGYYSNKITTRPKKNVVELLPLLQDSVNSPAMVKHCMTLLKDLISHLNPQQDPVITGDQPVYALGKQVQWMYPNSFENVVWMMGPLHIEMAFINVIGDWLEGSGWCEVFNKANISTPGRIESFLTGKHVKRSRYAHQLSLSTLCTMVQELFQQSGSSCYETWVLDFRKRSVNADYWFTVIELETILFMFIRSLRCGDFDMFVRSLQEILPWMFALDHVHYSRWMSVFLHDLEKLPITNENVFQNFMNGRFVVNKSSRIFSSMGEDQAHEQNNKVIKIDGGVVGILDNENALLKWATSGPTIAKMIENVKLNDDVEDEFSHHEDTDSFEKKFRNEKTKLLDAFVEMGNPFEESGDCLVNIATKHVISKTASDSVKTAKEKGKTQSKEFKETCLKEGKVSIYKSISKNKLALFRQKNAITTTKKKQELVSLKSDCRLYANLYVACQVRQSNLDDFFSHENHAYPPAISEYGKLRKCNEKSAFLKCLEDLCDPVFDQPDVECCVIDGAAFVHMHPPHTSKTYGQYCAEELQLKLGSIISQVNRVDLVFDVYHDATIKSQTRENRGEGVRVSIRKETPILKNFKQVLRNDENKTELFNMIAAAVTFFNSETLLVATTNEHVTSNQEIESSRLERCNHEEADTRVFIHVNDASRNGMDRVKVVTVDTDVVVIALCVFPWLALSELWIEIGTGQHRRWLPIHKYAAVLGEETCSAIPFWYSVTGCDTVSMFAGRGKKTCWNVWKSYPEVTSIFARLCIAENLTDDDWGYIQRFVILLYDRTSTSLSVNECRRNLFTKGRLVHTIPPTEDALKQHIKRAMLQSHIWTKALTLLLPDFEYHEWGWQLQNTKLTPKWMTLPQVSESCHELVKCGCKTTCSGRCKCYSSGLSCTELCACNGNC